MAMDRAEFEADLRREGYELREGEIEPNAHRGAHAHEFDARLLADGMRYLAGRRPATKVAAAE